MQRDGRLIRSGRSVINRGVKDLLSPTISVLGLTHGKCNSLHRLVWVVACAKRNKYITEKQWFLAPLFLTTIAAFRSRRIVLLGRAGIMINCNH